MTSTSSVLHAKPLLISTTRNCAFTCHRNQCESQLLTILGIVSVLVIQSKGNMSSETFVPSNEEHDGSSLKDNSEIQYEEEVPVEFSTKKY